MWKYYILAVVAVVLILTYTYISDPCNRMLRTDFAQRNPSYLILDSGADEGTREIAYCRISYRKPGDMEIYQDIWVYQYQGTRWEFSKAVETEKKQTP